jgi:predicted DNA-binding WGR domain protein
MTTADQDKIERPSQETITRRDPDRRMARFYSLRVQGSLFGATPEGRAVRAWSLIREWGRIGSPGRVRADPHTDIGKLEAEAARIAAAKRRKGYR